MAITLVENPVVTESGVVKNLFAGFLPVEFKFKREDLQIISVGAGANNAVLVTISQDLTSELNVGESAYLYAEGTNYTYDDSGEITAITSNSITIDINFIEAASSGYINYKQNYYLETELVDTDNSDVKILPFTIKDDGDNSGNITIDASLANDKNERNFEFALTELTEGRLKFKVQYREVWRESNTSYSLIGDEIILYYATDQVDTEQLVQELDEAFLYEGYPFGGIALHSDQNVDGISIVFAYDELDINKANVSTDNSIGVIQSDKFGQLFVNLDKGIVYSSDAEFVKINATFSDTVAFFDPAFFDPAFFETT